MSNEYYEALRNQSYNYKDRLLQTIQSTMSNGISKNLLDEFIIKMGMPEYKKTVKRNFTKDIECLLERERMKEKVLNLNTRGLYTYPNKIETGDYITYDDGREIANYLVVSRVDRKTTHDYTLVQHCPFDNRILGSDGLIYNYPLYPITNKTKLGVSERSDTAITLNSTFQGQIRADAISRRFVEECETGKRIERIIMNGIAYKIQETDTVAMKGLILLGYEKDQITTNDNIELGIPDYHNNISPTPTPSQIVGYDTIEIGGSEEYSIDTLSSWTWSLVGIGGISITSVNNNKSVVSCNYNTSLIGHTVILKCITAGVTYEKSIKIVGLGG